MKNLAGPEGDPAPVLPLARTLAWIEAITGQVYLATLVAGLVGLKVSQAIEQKNSDQSAK